MNVFTLTVLFTAAFCASKICGAAEGPVCHKCEIIREENKKKVNPYEYYEDYLKEHPEEKKISTTGSKSESNNKKNND